MKKILLTLLTIISLAGCSQNNPGEDGPGIVTPGGENPSQENPEQNQDNEQEEDKKDPTIYTSKIDFSGSSFASAFPAGTGFTTDKKVEQLSNYIDTYLEYDNLYASLAVGNLHTQAYNNNTYLQFGSGSEAVGVFTINASESSKICKVEVEVMNYIKSNSYQGFNSIDSWSHFLIDDEEFNMEYDGANPPTIQTYNKEYNDGVDTFTVSSKYGRVYMKSMTITWSVN